MMWLSDEVEAYLKQLEKPFRRLVVRIADFPIRRCFRWNKMVSVFFNKSNSAHGNNYDRRSCHCAWIPVAIGCRTIRYERKKYV